MDIAKLTASITANEGTILYVYDDANDKPIVKGYTVIGTPTIGSGINLCTGITQIENDYLTSNRILAASREAQAQPWWQYVDGNDVRERAVTEIVFNLGIGGISEFHVALAAMERGDWNACGAAFLNSLWSRQVGKRAEVLAKMIMTGTD